MRTAQVLHLPGIEVSLQLEIDRLRHQLQMIQIKLDEMIHIHHQQIDKVISVFVRGQYQMVHVSEIQMIKAMNNYSMIYLDGGAELMTSRTLKYWEKQCACDDLVRIHNSFLIHKHKITAIQPYDCTIALRNGLTAQYTRKSKTWLLLLLGQKDRTQGPKTPKSALHPLV